MVRHVAGMLAEAGIDSAEREARWLVESASGKRMADLVAGSEPFSPAARERAVELARRRCDGEPLQYVTGRAGFRRLELAVGPGVLIPRPETETTTERALGRLPRGGTLVDVGTGSGAIALAVASERPDVGVYATEASPHALRWARRNRDALALDVELIACDLFEGLPVELGGAVDVVVSNPPYVATSDAAVLPREVVEHEPHEALFAGEQGLSVTERVASEARTWLRKGGWLVVEVAFDTSRVVAGLLDRLGYDSIEINRDLAGRPRVVEGRRA